MCKNIKHIFHIFAQYSECYMQTFSPPTVNVIWQLIEQTTVHTALTLSLFLKAFGCWGQQNLRTWRDSAASQNLHFFLRSQARRKVSPPRWQQIKTKHCHPVAEHGNVTNFIKIYTFYNDYCSYWYLIKGLECFLPAEFTDILRHIGITQE